MQSRALPPQTRIETAVTDRDELAPSPQFSPDRCAIPLTFILPLATFPSPSVVKRNVSLMPALPQCLLAHAQVEERRCKLAAGVSALQAKIPPNVGFDKAGRVFLHTSVRTADVGVGSATAGAEGSPEGNAAAAAAAAASQVSEGFGGSALLGGLSAACDDDAPRPGSAEVRVLSGSPGGMSAGHTRGVGVPALHAHPAAAVDGNGTAHANGMARHPMPSQPSVVVARTTRP